MKHKLLSIFMLLITFIGYSYAQDETWHSYNDGIIAGTLSPIYGVSDYEVAILYTSNDIKKSGFNTISHVKIGCGQNGSPAGISSSTVIIWQNDEEIATKSFSFTAGWQTIEFDTPVPVDQEFDLYVGVRYITTNSLWSYAGYDATLDYSGKGDLYREFGSATWSNENTFGDWCIGFNAYYEQQPTYISYDNGIISDAVNRLGGTDYEIAIKYTSADIKALGFSTIYEVKVGAAGQAGPPPSSTVIIWQDNIELTSQSFPFTFNGWNTIVLNNPQVIDPEKDLYVGVRFNTGNENYAYAAHDNNLDYPGKGDLVRLVGSTNWNTANILGDWCVQMAVDLPAPPSSFNVIFKNIQGMSTAVMPPMFVVDDAIITLGDKVNEAGNYVFTVAPGEYRYVISKEDLSSLGGTLTVIDRDIEMDMTSAGYMMNGLDGVHTITFDIKDDQDNPLTDALVTFNKYEWDGYSANNVKMGIHHYVISKFGYETVEGSVLVVGNETIDVVLTALPAYSVTFGVWDNNTLVTISDATISINDIQNAAGEYVFNNIPEGIYKYIVKKEGYITTAGIINVPGNNPGVMLQSGNEQPLRNVTIEVVDEKGSILNLAVQKVNGNIVPYQFTIESGIYDYTVECEGYTTKTGKIVVAEDGYLRAVMIPKQMYKTFFRVFSMAGGTYTPINDATISFGKTLNTAGNYKFNTPEGSYTYIVKKEGYKSHIETITVDDRDQLISIPLVVGTDTPASLTFDILDEEGKEVTDAVITFDGVTKSTGDYIIENYEIGVYDYSIVLEGYETISGKYILTETKTENVTLIIDRYDIGFMLSGNVLDAVISLDENVNESGNYKYQQVAYGVYQYVVRAEGYETKYGTVHVPNNFHYVQGYGWAYDVLMNPTYKITFDIKDEEGNAISDAIIILNGYNYGAGGYVINDLLPGNYLYSVNKEGFYTTEGTVTITNENKELNVILAPITHTVTFIVKDNSGNLITDAFVVFDNTTYEAGVYEFANLLPGNYSYTVNKEGYFSEDGTVTITEDDIEVKVTINQVGIDNVLDGVLVYPNPFNEKIIVKGEMSTTVEIFVMDINGRYILNTSFNGEKTLLTSQLSNGIYFVIIRNNTGKEAIYKMIKK